mgnify:CR=1 FL=1
MKKFLLGLIVGYQQNYPLSGKRCVFIPSCSEYTYDAIEKYGPRKGVWLGMKRIFRCHPFQKNRIDPLL